MLSYRHAFHAGGFADVLKHVVLVALVEALARKEGACCCLETHAGAGGYDLAAHEAAKGREHEGGVWRVLAARRPPGPVARYAEIVRAFDARASGARGARRRDTRRAARPRWYPGSPRILHALLRPDDRLVLCELHPAEVQALRTEFRGEPRVHVHARDGYEALGALLPPVERRGLVLVDPSYETDDEIACIEAGLDAARRRWPTGIYAVWYPLLARRPVDRLLDALAGGAWRRVLRAEVRVRPPDAPIGLTGAGVALLNAPWRIDEALAPALPWLAEVLADGDAGARLEWLVPE